MVRTKADSGSAAGRKVVAARAPRKSVGSGSSAAGCSSSNGPGASPSANKYAGGNPVCPRPTPDWQKGISQFFITKSNKENTEPDVEEGSSGSELSSSQPGGSGASSSSAGSRSSKTKSGSSRIQDDSDDENDS